MGTTKYIQIDMRVLNQRERYEDEYGHYLAIFQQIAITSPDQPIVVTGAPASWVPLLRYLRCQVAETIIWFPHDRLLEQIVHQVDPSDRTTIEVLCGFRPELVDALWKCDMQWISQRPIYDKTKPFVVTNNGSFHRQEVLRFLDRLRYTQNGLKDRGRPRNCVILPCAADKPFPAALHRSVLAMLPPRWHALIATGVCGLVDQEDWPNMPWYDSGIPNRWRVYTAVRDYFRTRRHERVVLYIDFYSEAVADGLTAAGQKFEAVNPVQFYADYLDLNDPERLKRLEHMIGRTGAQDQTQAETT